jgi:phenylacetate-CoA ligase
MSLRNLFTEKVILPISDLITRQSVYRNIRFLEKSQWWSHEEIDKYQNEKLRKLIKHSVTSVPYYKELFARNNLVIEDIQTKEDLYKIPILTKEEIKKQGINSFLSSNYPKSKTLSASSSGSTGEPLFYKTTKDAYSLNIAANLRGWKWSGFNIGDRYIKLSQNPRNNTLKKLQDKISNNLYLATNPLIDSNFDYILKEIESYKPLIIRCYPDPLLFLARYKKEHPEFNYQPKSITTTGNTLYPEIRNEIEEAFGCKIFDSYSCEGNSNVFECETHNGYHSAEEYGITEILDEYDNLIHHGVGRLISTDLYNFAHPFIRYDTQDQVEILGKSCSCKRNLLFIKRILGRSNDIIKSSTGQRFIVHNFTGFFQTDDPNLKKAINNFQIVKSSDSNVTFNLVVNENYSPDVGEYIVSFWQEQLKCEIRIKILDEITLTQSGKRKFIINEK